VALSGVGKALMERAGIEEQAGIEGELGDID
jgi:hypothetical protein